MKRKTNNVWAHLFLMMMLIGFTLTLIGCKSKHSVTESVKTEYVDRCVHDTIWKERITYIVDSARFSNTIAERDCTVVRQDAQGNVIRTDRWHSKDTKNELSHSKEKVDSTAYYRSIIDSLRRIKNVSNKNTVYVEKELSFWDKLKIDIGGYAFVILSAMLIYRTWYIKRKDRQNI